MAHLEQTGVGRVVNRLSPWPGEVGSRARHLVDAWRKVVNEEELAQERERQRPPEEQPHYQHTVSVSALGRSSVEVMQIIAPYFSTKARLT